VSKQSGKAAILCVGNELTEGKTGDVHGKYLSAFLRELNFTVVKILVIADEWERFVREIKGLLGEADVVIVTGGLGPTSDDLSREVVAEVAGVQLEFRQDIWDALVERFSGRKISETNRKQAYIPAGFTVFENPRGTAPGFAGGVDSGVVVALPGPPRELQGMVQESLRPYLMERFHVSPVSVLSATAFLVPESELEEVLQESRQGDVHWGTRAESLRITFFLRGGSEADREALFQAVQDRLSSERIHRGEVDAAWLVYKALELRSYKLVCAESCTGGLVTKLLTDIAGSSSVLWGAFVCYSNTAKEKQLDVDRRILEEYGAVSEEAVRAMAAGALSAAEGGADVAIAISGVAGPSGGTPEKPVGTVWISAALRRRGKTVIARQYQFGGGRDLVRRRSAVAAFLLIVELLEA